MFNEGQGVQFNGLQGVHNDAPDFLLEQIVQATDPLNPTDAQRIRQQLEPARDAITQAIAEAMKDMQAQAQLDTAAQQVPASQQILRTFGSSNQLPQRTRTNRQIAQSAQTRQTTSNITPDTRPAPTADTTFLSQTNDKSVDDSPLYPDMSLTPEMVEEPVQEPNSQTKQSDNRDIPTDTLQNNVENNRQRQIARISQARQKNAQLQQKVETLTQQQLLNQLKKLQELRKQLLQTAQSSQEIIKTFRLDTTSIFLLVLSVITSIVNIIDPTEFFAIFLSVPVSWLQLYKRIKTSIELKKYYLKKLPLSIALSIWNIIPILSNIPLKTIHDFYIDQFGRIHKRLEGIQKFRSSRTKLKSIDRQIRNIKKQLSKINSTGPS